MLNFKKWLEVGGTPWDAAPLQCPYDPEHPERGAFPRHNINELPPTKKKFGKNRFLMKKNMKKN